MLGLEAVDEWPGQHAVAVLLREGRGVRTLAAQGDLDRSFALASVTKVLSALGIMVEVARGSCALADQAGPRGATLAHLLSHCSGLPLDGTEPVAAPQERRIYSNSGIEAAVAHAAAGRAPATWLDETVLGPLGLGATVLKGSPASGATGSVGDLCMVAHEILVPSLLDVETAGAMRAVAFPGLAGVLPGFGRQAPCDWGLGLEVKGSKSPHWTGLTWPQATVGHFGQAGGFIAVDHDAGIAIVTLGDEAFGPWSKVAWPALFDDVRARLAVP
jgi:CubicO group peptidase (beta-lactamase class C family)